MSKHLPQIEWEILDEPSDSRHYPAFAGVDPELPVAKQRRYQLYYLFAAAVLLLVLAAGGWLWQRAQAGIAQIDTDLQHAVAAELWLASHRDPRRATALLADPASVAWHAQFSRENHLLSTLQASALGSQSATDINVVEVNDQWAVVHVTVDAISDAGAYRQARFYRYTPQGWRHTAPAVEWWGTPEQFESDYFIFVFRQRDAGVVAEVAPRVDAMYREMRRNFGLAMAPASGKPVVEISPAEAPGAVLLHASSPPRFVVPSPDLYLAPGTVTSVELVLQSLALRLAVDVLEEARMHHRIYWVRRDMLNALRLWTIWDLDLPLADWREDVVTWRLAQMHTGDSKGVAILPDRYPELCALHSVWLPSPALISIPLTCTEQAGSPAPVSLPNTLAVTHLEQLTTDLFWPGQNPRSNTHWTGQPGDTVILATFVEYVVSRYGRDQLPLFVAGLGQHRSWDTLSLAVFGIAPDELAAGWHAYLIAP
jgi:hypothetical protein